jgi:hypothetical protein
MAERTRRRAADQAPPAPIQPEVLTPSVTTQLGDETFTYYANYAEITHMPHDFALLFAGLPSKLPPDQMEEARAGNLTLTCDVQILIPTTLIDGLIRALTTQKAAYEQRYGTIHEPGASDAEDSNE